MKSVINQKNKIDELESIRGLAAIVVVMYHIPGWHPFLHHISFIRGGGLMVDLFFVLSGFVIYSAYSNRLQSTADFLKFQFLRFGRLYPVHITFLIVFLGIETLKYVLQHYYGIQSHSKPPFVENDFPAFLRELFLVKAFWPNDVAMAFNSPAWSISAEFYTYIIFGLITLFAKKFKDLIFVMIAIVCIAALFVFKPEQYNFMLRCLSGFFVGCLTALTVKSLVPKSHVKLVMIEWMIPISIALIIWITSISKGYYGVALLIYPASALLIASISLSNTNIFKQMLAHPLLIWLGTISYSLYMSHGAVLWGFQQFLRVAFHRDEILVRGISTPQFTQIEACALIILFMAFALFVAQITYHLIEQPWRVKSRDFINVK
jgi:peptidoglycan/LPS O-acetylase OafA/YrhL